mgnify:CR=1 FL=1
MSTPHWIETGAGSRALLFLHGVSGGAEGARDLLPRITPPGWRGLAWDMPGYGASPAIEPTNFDGYARAVVALLDGAGIESVVLVGHSMGGMVALQTAAAFPDRVAALALVCCTPAFGASTGALQQAFLARRTGPLDEGASMREVAVELIPTMVGPGGDPEVVGAAVDLMAEIPPDSYRAALQALVNFDQRTALPRLAMPALVFAGRFDGVSAPLVVRRMAERMPAAIYRELDAGHLAPFEEPEDFAAVLQAFLGGLHHAPVTSKP